MKSTDKNKEKLYIDFTANQKKILQDALSSEDEFEKKEKYNNLLQNIEAAKSNDLNIHSMLRRYFWLR